MLSASPIHSATLVWKCDVASRDTPSSRLFPLFIISNALGMKYQVATKKIMIIIIIIIITMPMTLGN